MTDIVELSLGEYAGIRNEYRSTLYAEIAGYLSGSGTVAKYKNAVRRAVNAAFNDASDMGYVDGGGSLPSDPATNEWLNNRVAAEFANVDTLFTQLAELRKDPEFQKSETMEIAETRSDGYSVTLDGIYNESKVRGAGNKNVMLTFGGEDGHTKGFPCRTCRKLKGQRHRANWWIKRGYIPYPGNENFECRTYQCKHFLYTDDGSLFTL